MANRWLQHSFRSIALIAAGLLLAVPTYADIVAGVETGEPAPEAEPGRVRTQPPARGATVIGFDESSAPCLFSATSALREEYASLGIHFSGGTGPNDGGAILDECGNFGVNGQSSPNFLAFNVVATMSSGGVPQPPQIISFDFPISSFQINAGSRFPGTLDIEARDAGDALVDSAQITLGTGLQTVSVSGAGIRTITIDATSSDFVLDDMAFDGAPVPSVPIFGYVALLAALALISLYVIRRKLSAATG